MPDLRSTVQKMVAAGESEEDIAAVIKKLKGSSEIKSGLPDMSPELQAPAPRDTYTGPDTFWGGVKKAFTPGGDVDKAGWEGFKGNLESIKDIPANLAYGAKDMLDFHLNPGLTSLRMGESLKQIPEIVKNAGADPRTFGRTVGAFTTAPLVTEGLGVAALRGPGAINRIPRVNKTLSSLGSTLEGTRNPNYVPSTSRGLVAGAVRGVARPIGRVLSRAGERGRLAGGTAPPSRNTLIKLKDETPDEAAARNSPNKPPNEKVYAGGGQGATRPRPLRHDTPDLSRSSEFTRPILETAEELAARKRPSAFTGGASSRNRSIPFEPRPVDTTPYPRPGEIPEGIPGEAPLVRDTRPYPRPGEPPAGLPPEAPIVRDTTPYPSPLARPPGIPPERSSVPTPDPINVLEGGPSSRYRHRPYEPGQEAAAIAENAGKPKTAPPVEPTPAFEPSIDPAATNLSPEDIALMQSRRAELKAALQKMAGGESVDTTTGEIHPRTKGPWRQSEHDINPNEFDFGPEETGVEGFGPNDPSLANDTGKPPAGEPVRRPKTRMEVIENIERKLGRRLGPDELEELTKAGREVREERSFRGLKDSVEPPFGRSDVSISHDAGRFADEVEATRYPGDEAFDLGEINPGFRQTPSMPNWGPETINSPRPVNPLRPEVPKGQQTNRSMFELSEQRAAQMRANEAQQFNDSIGHEFDQDMMLTPDEFRQPDVPEFTSPFENQNDPRISGLPPRADAPEARTIAPEEWGDWGGLEADIPTLVPDASGSHVAAPRKSQFSAQANEEAGFSGPKKIADTADDSSRDSITLNDDTPMRSMDRSTDNLIERYDRNAARVSPENRDFIRQLPDDALEDFINRQSRNPNYMDHSTGRDMVYHASDVQEMREAGQFAYRPPGEVEPPRRQIVDWNNRGTNNPEAGSRYQLEPGEPIPQRRRAPERDIRFDADTQNFWDRNSGYWDDVSDATPEEIARARGINDGSIEDPTAGINPLTGKSPTHNKGITLQAHESAREGQGRSRLGKLFGEETAAKLASGEKTGATTGNSQKPMIRSNNRKRIPQEEIDHWNKWGDDSLEGISYKTGKPGLSVETDSLGGTDVIYRDANGKPIGMMGTDHLGKGIDHFAVSSKLGVGRGRVSFKLLREAIDRGFAEAAGTTSPLTKNLIERYLQLMRDKPKLGTADDVGMFGNSEMELELNKIMNGEVSESMFGQTQPNERMGFSGKPDSGTANDKPKPVREVTLQGKKFPVYSNEDFSALRQQYEIRPAYLSETMPPGGKPKDLIYLDMGNGENRPHKIVGPSKGTSNDDPFKGMTNNKSRLVKTPKEPNFPSVIPEGFEKVSGNKPGPAGAAYRITDPNGKHLGDINVTPKDIAEVKKMNDGVLADVPDEDLAKELYKNRLEAMLAQHGFSPDDMPRMKIDAMDNRLKKSGPTELKDGKPAFSTTKKTEEPRPLPANFGTDKLGEAVSFPNDTFAGSVDRPGLSGRGQLGAGETPKPSRFKAKAIDPDEAFARGGDIGPIVQEAAKLMFDNAVDSKFRSLLPEQMRGPLETGQTYQGKLKRLIEEIEGEYTPEQGAQRYAELEAFNDSIRGYSRNPIDILPLDPKSVDISKLRPGKLNQQKPWVSPRAQQKYKRSLDDVKKKK